MQQLLLMATLIVLTAGRLFAADPLGDHFVPPEVIMGNQHELGITEAQRERIKKEVVAAQVRFTELQWDLQARVETLSNLLAGTAVDDQAAVAELNRVLETEGEIKRTQLSMLLALRSVLSPEQLEKAESLRFRRRSPRALARETERMQRQLRRDARQIDANLRRKRIEALRELRRSLQKGLRELESKPSNDEVKATRERLQSQQERIQEELQELEPESP